MLIVKLAGKSFLEQRSDLIEIKTFSAFLKMSSSNMFIDIVNGFLGK